MIKIAQNDLNKLAKFIRDRSEDYSVVIKPDGTFVSGGEPLSMKKFAKVLIQDVKAKNLIKIKDRDLQRLVNLAIKGTKHVLMSEEDGWKRMSDLV